MKGLEAFLPRESTEAITYIKVIFTVTFWGGKTERGEECCFFLFFQKQIISGCVIARSRYIKKSN